jgi:GTP-binding protein
MPYVPIAFVVGQTGQNVKALLDHAQTVFAQSRERVTTARLNRLVRSALERNPPPLHGRVEPKIYYATQVAVQPPTVVLLCNSPRSLSKPYQRYLLGMLRDELGFTEVPIKLYLRRRVSGDETDEIDSEMRRKKR